VKEIDENDEPLHPQIHEDTFLTTALNKKQLQF
jgi:hypothetical protein